MTKNWGMDGLLLLWTLGVGMEVNNLVFYTQWKLTKHYKGWWYLQDSQLDLESENHSLICYNIILYSKFLGSK